jgi:hypothetical protein
MSRPSVLFGSGFIGSPAQAKITVNQTPAVSEKKAKTGTIKPANRGKFTAKAKGAGESVAGYANKVLKPGSGASKATKKQAVFAKNAQTW